MTTITPAVGRAMSEQLQRVRSGAGVANYLNGNGKPPRSPKPTRPVTWEDIERIEKRQKAMLGLILAYMNHKPGAQAEKGKAALQVTPPEPAPAIKVRDTISSTDFAQAQRKSLSTINRALNDGRVRMADGGEGAYQQANGQWRVYVGAVLIAKPRKGKARE